ncbi:hypothetical protein AMATHDRAFT_69650, partial [Amanita thiersii Skay4041]
MADAVNSSTHIHQLYPDILLEIFRSTLAEEWTDTITLPFVLSQVCVKWRQIAISSPRLWTEIRIPEDPLEYSEDNFAKCLPILFERSGSLPLIISYDCEHKSEENGDGAIISSLLSQVHRWGDVEFRFYTFPPFENLHAPHLRRFVMRHVEDDTDGPAPFPFAYCPFLERLCWPWVQTLPAKSDVLNWDQIV